MHRVRNIIVLGLWVVCSLGGRLVAQVPEQAQSLNELFERAVEAEEAAYGDVREAILLRDVAAVPLLERMRPSEDRHRRIVAEGMLSWIREPETNSRRQQLLRIALVSSIGVITGPIDGIIAAEAVSDEDDALPDMERALVTFAPRLGQDELHQHSAAPFLLELIIKGAIGPPSPEEIERVGELVGKLRKDRLMGLGRNPNYGLWARCYAAVLVGRLDHPDVVSVLTEVLRSSKHPELRTCAAAGLHNTRSVEGVGPLIEALSDAARQVRESAYYALREIAGQDFGQDQQKYRTWWERNKAKLKPARKSPTEPRARSSVSDALEDGHDAKASTDNATANDMERRFGTESVQVPGGPLRVIFIEGRYIDAPYRLTRRGLTIYVNGIEVERLAWPSPYYIAEDPPLPEGLNADSRLADIKPWMCRKSGYYYSHFPPEDAVQMSIKAYRALPCVK